MLNCCDFRLNFIALFSMFRSLKNKLSLSFAYELYGAKMRLFVFPFSLLSPSKLSRFFRVKFSMSSSLLLFK